MSTKSWESKQSVPFPLDEFLTAQEKPLVHVQAYDRSGNGFVVRCKKLTSNSAYRFISGWRKFLTNTDLILEEDVKSEEVELTVVELWAFRSPLLKVGVHGQPDGPLGFVVVHYRQGESPHADAAIAQILAAAKPRGIGPRRKAIHHVHKDAVPVLQVHDNAVPILEDDAMPVLEDAVDAHVDTVPAVEVDEEEMEMLEAAKAMLMLRYSFPTKIKRRRVCLQ
jgi:hypothetical protein